MQVLATDMNKHMEHVAHLKTMVERRRISGSSDLNMDTYSERIQVRQGTNYCDQRRPIGLSVCLPARFGVANLC